MWYTLTKGEVKMAERIQKTKTTDSTEEVIEELPKTEKRDLSALDDLLDEIDGVLEENAQEFVSNYIQKGGE